MTQLYAIVGNIGRAAFMLKAGVPFLQLRFKNTPLSKHRKEITRWISEFPQTRVIINDDLEFAEEVEAWGVHLGQEDLARYSQATLLETPMKLGISTHSDDEIERALEYSPALLGFGPIFQTSSKSLRHPPQGVAKLRKIVLNVPLPIVAIGGIEAANLVEIASTGVSMAAMIAYLDQFTNPGQIQNLISRLKSPTKADIP